MVHELAEQSVVQWALECDVSCRELAAAVIRIQNNMKNVKDIVVVPAILRNEATKSSGDGSFCKKALEAIEFAEGTVR